MWKDTIQVGMKVRHYKGRKEATVLEMTMEGVPTEDVFKNKSKTSIRLRYDDGTIKWRRRSDFVEVTDQTHQHTKFFVIQLVETPFKPKGRALPGS